MWKKLLYISSKYQKESEATFNVLKIYLLVVLGTYLIINLLISLFLEVNLIAWPEIFLSAAIGINYLAILFIPLWVILTAIRMRKEEENFDGGVFFILNMTLFAVLVLFLFSIFLLGSHLGLYRE